MFARPQHGVVACLALYLTAPREKPLVPCCAATGRRPGSLVAVRGHRWVPKLPRPPQGAAGPAAAAAAPRSARAVETLAAWQETQLSAAELALPLCHGCHGPCRGLCPAAPAQALGLVLPEHRLLVGVPRALAAHLLLGAGRVRLQAGQAAWQRASGPAAGVRACRRPQRAWPRLQLLQWPLPPAASGQRPPRILP